MFDDLEVNAYGETHKF